MKAPQMKISVKRWYRSRKDLCVIIVLICAIIVMYFVLCFKQKQYVPFKYRDSGNYSTKEKFPEDKNVGCEMPKLDPFSKEMMIFDKDLPKVQCPGRDWVSCWHSKCSVHPDIKASYSDIQCTYRDIIYDNDFYYYLGPPVVVTDPTPYVLKRSDHAKVKCKGYDKNSYISFLKTTWSGHVTGFRTAADPELVRDDGFNVLFLAFDSTSRNGFMRRMAKSFMVIKEELRGVVLNGYNIVGDGTPAALFPILTGSTEQELPGARKGVRGSGFSDQFPFIFYKLRDEGYRTAYFEDQPYIGTFQLRFNGFRRQPTDHYLRSFYQEKTKTDKNTYCVGGTPQYQLMLNITDQFFKLPGKKFGFTFISDISHDNFNLITSADEAVSAFLRSFKAQGRLENTLLIVMGDHGPRYEDLRNTYQGMLEERLPLMSIVLPKILTNTRPSVEAALLSNVNKLTTPHDLHAMMLDVLSLRRYWNKHVVFGAKMKRGLSLLQEIPQNRTCKDAGIEPYWCACTKWYSLVNYNPMYDRVAHALLEHLNNATKSHRSQCALRTLSSVQSVRRGDRGEGAGYLTKGAPRDIYSVKIIVGPGTAVFEALVTYFDSTDIFNVDSQNVQRINRYSMESSCISTTYPQLSMYCYCISNNNDYYKRFGMDLNSTDN